MMLGDIEKFAIESDAIKYYRDESKMALGFFNIHINGIRYGVHEKDASMLSCSYGEVNRRVLSRGAHVFPFGNNFEAIDFVSSFRKANYGIGSMEGVFFKGSEVSFLDSVIDNKLLWAPDGDEAFDDGGHVFQFDLDNYVRIIGFINGENPELISDVVLDGSFFYETLAEWQGCFYKEWEKNKHI